MTADQQHVQTVLGDVVAELQQSFQHNQSILSYQDYMHQVVAHPWQHLRSSAQLLLDMLSTFGVDQQAYAIGPRQHWRLFDMPLGSEELRIYGQEHVQEAIYASLRNFAREGRNNRLLLLHGPNGSAKSSLCRALMQGLEWYGRMPQGAMYSFSWIFPKSMGPGAESIGFASQQRHQDPNESFAHLPAESIDACVPCEIRDHPLFLLPAPQRTHWLGTLALEPQDLGPQTLDASASASSYQHTLSDYIRTGDLCPKCRQIFDGLQKAYNGDMQRILAHVRVERFYPSRRYNCAMATIEPQMGVDAVSQQVTADRTLAALPKSLQHLNLFASHGPLIAANRGILEYSDLLKRPVETFKYLLSSIETAWVALEHQWLHLDMVSMASTNEIYLQAFRQHPDFPSFRGRMQLIRVPYLLRLQDETAMYSGQITQQRIGKHIAPHSRELAALFALLTRIHPAKLPSVSAEIGSLLEQLTPYEKIALYDSGKLPERLTSREGQELLRLCQPLFAAGQQHVPYEGSQGISAREIRTVLLQAAQMEAHHCLHPLGVMKILEDLCHHQPVLEGLQRPTEQGGMTGEQYMAIVQQTYLQWIEQEIRQATGLAAEESVVALLVRYVAHVSAWVKQEKLLDSSTGSMQDPDGPFMVEIERILLRGEERAVDFRRNLIGSIGAKALEEPEAALDYAQLFRRHLALLRDHYYNSRKKAIGRMCSQLLQWYGGDGHHLAHKEQQMVSAMAERLEQQFHYCRHCAQQTVAHAYQHLYQESASP